MSAGRASARTAGIAKADLALSTITDTMSPPDVRRTTRNRESGAWINIQPTFVNGLSLSRDEFRDGMRMRYGLEVLWLQKNCDGCGGKFSVEHRLKCKKGGLVVGHHDEIKSELAFLAE